jgi:hypothetical protein
VSTAEDIVRFATALIDGKIVKPETLASMWKPTGLPSFQGNSASTYGIGFSVTTIDGQMHVSHSGGQQGTSTDMEIVPGKRFAVSVFANDENARPAQIVRQIFDLYGMPRPRPPAR